MTRHDADLMQHADGELDEASERDVETYLAEDAAARGKVEVIGQVGEVVRGHLEIHADAVPDARFAAMWREIDKQIDLQAAPAAAAEPVKAPAAAVGSWSKVSRWLDRKLGYILTGVASAGAVAVIALVLRPGGDAVAPPVAPIEPIPVVHRPTQIESLETPGGEPTVLRLQDEDGDATVIWVTPDDIEGT